MSNGNGHRWSKFWWQDWANDPALRKCSLAAQGLWMRLLCIMHDAIPRGYLLVDGDPPTAKELAAITGATLREIATLLGELKKAKVYSQDLAGVIFSRRMVKDTVASERGHHTGRLGGNPALVKKEDPKPPDEGLTPTLNQTLNPTPYPKQAEVIHRPLTPPLNLEAEADSEVEAEERKSIIYNNSLSSKDLLGSRARVEAPKTDSLEALLDEAGIEKPRLDRSQDGEKLSANPAVEAQLRRTGKLLAMKVPYGEVRSPEAQIAANEAQPAAVGADVSLGLRWQPADPQRSRDEQIAKALADASPEQIEKARRYSERMARPAAA